MIGANGDVEGKPGVGDDSKCFVDLVKRLEAGDSVEIQMPIYDAVPDHKKYHISGFVTLRLTAICYNPSNFPSKESCKDMALPTWGNDARWISGTFVKRTALSSTGEPGSATDYGTKSVWLSYVQ